VSGVKIRGSWFIVINQQPSFYVYAGIPFPVKRKGRVRVEYIK
jgi:hypothetical protein